MIKDPVVAFSFHRAMSEEGTSSSIEHSYMTHESSPWMPIMLQFAAFLEGCGYVGVYQRVQDMIMWMEEEQDENTCHTRLSD